MEARPTGIDDDRLAQALLDGWGIDAVHIDYTPLGFGSHHWTVADRSGARRFVTVDELEGLAPSPAIAFAELASAFGTARALGERGFEFVVAPIPSLDGETVRHLGAGFSIAVFPYVDGRAGRWGEVMDNTERLALVERLASLHDATELVRSIAPRRDTEPIVRSIDAIEDALAQIGRAWTGGPFSEPARHWLRERERDVRFLVADATQLLEQTTLPPDQLVVTHGEPHPGNVIHLERGLVLIDWDTVGLAPPERDLWMSADDEQLLAHYTSVTGRGVDPLAIALYRRAWTLAEISVYLEEFRSPHETDEDTTHAWQVIQSLRWSTERS